MASIFFPFIQSQEGDNIFEEVVAFAVLEDEPSLVVETLDGVTLGQVVRPLATGDVLNEAV